MKKRNKTIRLNKKYLIAGLISLLTLGCGLFAGSKLFIKTNTQIKTETQVEFSDYKIELATELSRITFPFLLFISIVSFQSLKIL